VSELFSAYCALISSPSQLAQCREAKTLPELLQTIKCVWNIPGIDDNRLLSELGQLNQRVIEDPSVSLAGIWLPYRYNANSRSIYWCLPDGHASEPFQDESISRYRQSVLLNNLIQPQTPLDLLTHQAVSVSKAQPAGFIFHLSRCGSTLVSGCLSELDSTNVLSESPVLTELLLDPGLTEAEQSRCLQYLINLQASVFPDRPDIVVKWNAWDIFRRELIRAVYPDLPSLFLVRNPVEILASHQLSVGRHMSGDPSLGFLNRVFEVDPAKALPVLDFRINVLSGLLAEMQSTGIGENILRLDYRQLDLVKIVEVCGCFDIPVSHAEMERIKARQAFHSKSPGLRFDRHSAGKTNPFSAEEIAKIEQAFRRTDGSRDNA